MSRRRLVFETQNKRFYEGPDASSLVEILSDSSDRDSMLNSRISEYLTQGVTHMGVPSHFIKRLNMRETQIHHAEILPFTVFIRNRADEEYAQSMGFDTGAIMPEPIFEFLFHNGKGGERSIGATDLVTFELVSKDEFDSLMHYARRVNDFLLGTYWAAGYFLVDVKLDFGRQSVDEFQSILMLADDIGPLQAQLWDVVLSNETEIVRPDIADVAKRFGIQ